MSNEYFEIRRAKLKEWQQRQVAYPGRFEKKQLCAEAKALPEGTPVQIAGRLMALRDMGKLAFGHVQDFSGRVQIALKTDTLGEDFKFLCKNLDLGDHVGITGKMFITNKGEPTVEVQTCQLMSKALRPLPEKWHGITAPELRARYRYLDILTNEETRQRFAMRHKAIKFIRQFLDEHHFVEVETAMLQGAASGAMARPFVTHHNALDIPLYLRISPETYLKRLTAGGYERVYELGRNFRNEGMDPSHLQEFTMLEFYAAYWDYRDNMRFVQQLMQGLIGHLFGDLKITYQGVELDFSGDWPEMTYRDLVMEYTKIDLQQIDTMAQLQSEIRAKNLPMPLEKYKSLASLIDGLYKKFCRPKLIQPMFLTMHPTELIPLARVSDKNPKELDMFQVLVNSWEVVKAYSELVDPVLQREKLIEQQQLAAAGDDETMMLEEDFLEAMEYGMPPMSGVGIGIDRFVGLLTDSPSIRDTVFFPNLRNED